MLNMASQNLSSVTTVDLTAFGIFGPDIPADDALDALVQDESVREIRATTDVNFTRRHLFFRTKRFLHHLGRVFHLPKNESGKKDAVGLPVSF